MAVDCRALVERTTSERMWSGIAPFFASMGQSGAKRTPDHDHDRVPLSLSLLIWIELFTSSP